MTCIRGGWHVYSKVNFSAFPMVCEILRTGTMGYLFLFLQGLAKR